MHRLYCKQQIWQIPVPCLQRAEKKQRVLNVLMNHLISQGTHGKPVVCRWHPAQAFSLVQIVCHRCYTFTMRSQQSGQQFVAQGVLQATKTADKSVHALTEFGLGIQLAHPINREHRYKQALAGLLQELAFTLGHSAQKLQPLND
ncbi:MAG TPA: hypothetical protein PK347_11570 [Burkholderiaceae bacterium]|nr:hypothetical protein [Burkholderiaceae bacterium]